MDAPYPYLSTIAQSKHNQQQPSQPIQASDHNTLRIDAAALIPSILTSILGSDSKEVLALSKAIQDGKATKRDKRRLIKLLDKASRRLCN
jgi:hypothetical protein